MIVDEQKSRAMLFLSIIFLISAKVLPIYNYPITEEIYIDVDRVIALLLFLTVFFLKVERAKLLPLLLLLFSVPLFALLGFILEISFTKLIIMLFLTALIEEILLRGVLFHLLMKKLTKVQVLFSTSIFFTLVHPSAYSDFSYGLMVFLTGLVLGGIYLLFIDKNRQLGIVVATIIHMSTIVIGLHLGII